MDNIKNDDYYLNRIITDITFIVNHMKNVDLQELHDNEILLDSMLFRMIQISENAKRLSSDYRDVSEFNQRDGSLLDLRIKTNAVNLKI